MIEHNGKMYARVSDIIRPFSDFSHISPVVLANKARIGTAVHQVIADDIQGEIPVVDDETRGYFQSYCRWRDEICPTFLYCEKRYFCDKWTITGQIDALVSMTGEPCPLLVDFKTSVTESPITWPMQAHLYLHILLSNGIVPGLRFLFIKLDKNGALPTVFSYNFEQRIHKMCEQAVKSFWENDKK